MRRCIDCDRDLDEGLFDIRGSKRKGRQATCKPCSILRTKSHRHYIRKIVNRWKVRKGCVKCGFTGHHFQLHLDHIDVKTKKNKGNSRAYEPSWSIERVKEELRKCQILCANCHALKTFMNKDYLRT